MADFVQKEFSYLSMICIFISLIKILIDESPFSKTLSYCVRIVSVLYLVGSVLFPRLSGYQSSGFDIIKVGDFVLVDGNVLLFGLLLYIFGLLIQEGFKMQKELDAICQVLDCQPGDILEYQKDM
ncbi:MAG: helix-turn-helix domain-containing protein [Lachnospiraceae bacterium]|nr:helix-turn-helix domain-containing protein [Lachnospiraceae bacterium]